MRNRFSKRASGVKGDIVVNNLDGLIGVALRACNKGELKDKEYSRLMAGDIVTWSKHPERTCKVLIIDNNRIKISDGWTNHWVGPSDILKNIVPPLT